MKLEVSYSDFVSRYPKRYHQAIHYPEFLTLMRQTKDSKEIKKKLPQVKNSVIYYWLSGKTPLPFKEFSLVRKEFNSSDIDNLATIVGHVLGDGGITKAMFLRYSNTEEFLIKEFKSAMKDVFNAEPTTNHYKESSGIIRLTYPRLFSRILLCLFGEFSLGKSNKRITSQIENMPLQWKAKVLRAFYNDDGSVPSSKNYRCVAFKQKDKELIMWIQKTLRELKIESKLDSDGNLWHLRIFDFINMSRFRYKVGFSEGYRKQRSLDRILENIAYPHWKTKKEIINLLRKRPRTVRELSESLKLERGTIHGHLRGWERSERARRKSTIGLIDINLVETRKNGRKVIYSLNEKGYQRFIITDPKGLFIHT